MGFPMGGPVEIEGREYKLLLEPSAFPGAASEKAAKEFWTASLKPLIDKTLGAKSDGGSRAEEEPKLAKQRVVLFLETGKQLLAERQFTIRARSLVKDGVPAPKAEITLKLRTPDVLLAADYCRTAKEANPKTKLEEDIAPLAIASQGVVVVPAKRSTFSRFSVSTKVESDAALQSLADALRAFPMLRGGLAMGDRGPLADDLKLRAGPTICEWVFQKARVDLGPVSAEFTLTLWYIFDEPLSPALWQRAASGSVNPSAAEISFDFDTPGGEMDPKAALRSAKLFAAMQADLPMNARETSKTALGLPAGA